MGGGGTGPTDQEARGSLKKTEDATETKTFESKVNEMINDKLKSYNDRDSETTKAHLEEIQAIIDANFEGSIDLRFGGSVSKHTYVEGLSDADILVLINNSQLSDYTPQQVIHLIREHLIDKLTGVEEIKEGKLAVTVRYKDGTEIQLLPALSSGKGYKIPERNGKGWSNITRPDQFASKLTLVNQKCNGKVIPVIKIIKGINANQPVENQLSGYHIESLAIEAFKNYPQDLPKTPKAMLKYFYSRSSEIITSPIRDKTNQSIHVDDYLGSENSSNRYKAQYMLKKVYKQIERADSRRSVREWNEILGDI